MPAVKTRVLTAGLYLKKNELRLEIPWYMQTVQTTSQYSSTAV